MEEMSCRRRDQGFEERFRDITISSTLRPIPRQNKSGRKIVLIRP